MLLTDVQYVLRVKNEVAPSFQAKLAALLDTEDSVEYFSNLLDALEYLSQNTATISDVTAGSLGLSSPGSPYSRHSPASGYLKVGCSSSLPQSLSLLKALVLHEVSPDVSEVFCRFYQKAFLVYTNSLLVTNEPGTSDGFCGGCAEERAKCYCDKLLSLFNAISCNLNYLRLVDRVAEDILTEIIHKIIQQKINQLPTDDHSLSHLKPLKMWLYLNCIDWLKQIYQPDFSNPLVAQEVSVLEDFNAKDVQARRLAVSEKYLQLQKDRLKLLLYESYGDWLVQELFAMIIDYPESQPVLQDLRHILDHHVTGLRQKLSEKTKRKLNDRLLHPGVNTADILTAYIHSIKAFRFIDPSGVILENVCDSICSYLRKRSDTVRCIISFMTENCSDADLGGDLMREESLMLEEGCYVEDSSEDWKRWMPDPVDADISKDSKMRKFADVISMLVGIYGSKELFVKEYCRLLAERLLKTGGTEVEKEIRYLELLKLRFGESELHQCEVMIKDMQESQRIDQFVDGRRRDRTLVTAGQTWPFPVTTMILSGQFWPSMKEEKLKLPPYCISPLERYKTGYQSMKQNRTLEWMPSGGRVNLTLAIGDGAGVKCSVNPVLACIILKFTEKETWSLDELSTELECPLSVLRRRLGFWLYQGILREESPGSAVYSLTGVLPATLSDQSSSEESPLIVSAEDDLDDSMMVGQEDQDQEQLDVYWGYISGVFKTIGTLTTERIRSMLSMVSASPVSLGQVQTFLEGKVKSQLLTFAGGVYKLPKNG